MTFYRWDYGDKEVHSWTHVLPGDLVISPGTYAYRVGDVHVRNEDNTKMYSLAYGLLLIITRSPGTPEDPMYDGCSTFVVLSRHGLLTTIQYHNR